MHHLSMLRHGKIMRPFQKAQYLHENSHGYICTFNDLLRM